MQDLHLPSVDELVEFIESFVGERYRATRQPTNGARLADEIRHRFPGFSYEQIGLVRLSDAIAHGEAKGLFVRNRSVTHLEVLPAKVASISTVVPQPAWTRAPHIRPDLWRAFVFVMQGERHYFDRQTGSVIASTTIEDKPDLSRYVPIPCISLADQQQWMIDFLETNSQLSLSDAPIRDQYCFVKFPAWLRENEPGLDRSWKGFRVQRVAEVVARWASENAIESAGFISVPLSLPREKRGRSDDSRRDHAIRAAIMAAARELSIDQLQNISIPIRFVLQALQSR